MDEPEEEQIVCYEMRANITGGMNVGLVGGVEVVGVANLEDVKNQPGEISQLVLAPSKEVDAPRWEGLYQYMLVMIGFIANGVGFGEGVVNADYNKDKP